MTFEKNQKKWDLLISVGLPLGFSASVVVPKSWDEVFLIVEALIQDPMNDREADALRAWLLGVRDHYYIVFSKYLTSSSIRHFIDSKPLNGRMIKLRRIATAQLLKVA